MNEKVELPSIRVKFVYGLGWLNVGRPDYVSAKTFEIFRGLCQRAASGIA